MTVSLLRLTAEEKNYWRFSMLNVRVVPDALRNYFDSLIPPTSLATTINRYTSKISNLVKKKVINATQLNILQRIPGTIWPPKVTPVPIGPTDTSSANFDVTLIVCLLRNIPLPGIYPPVTGWDNLPNPNDKSPGAYLARIKYFRNEIAHSIENNLNNIDFQDKWKALSEAIICFNGGHSPRGIIDILHCDLDGSYNGDIVTSLSTEIDEMKSDLTLVEDENNHMKKVLRRTELQLENVRSDFYYYKDGYLPKNISDNIKDLINKWRKDDETFFVTRATKQVYDRLKSENIVMIVGYSGSGKSAMAHNVALKWLTFGYDVVPVESVEQILEYRCKETKQIFVMDDAVGKYSVSDSYVNQWERLDSKLSALFTDNNATLICTLRNVLAIDKKFKSAKTILSDKAYVMDLDHENNCLLSEEKLSILKNHLIYTDRQNYMSDEECRECCKANFAFPLLCHVFTTSDKLFQRKSEFFQKPFNYLNDEITKLHQRNKEVYCSLVICMIFIQKFSVTMFSVSDCSNKEQSGHILSMISEACGLLRNISRQTLFESLISVEGVYIKNISGKITFLHDSFLEAISFHFAKVNLCVFLECCDCQFLMQRVRVISPQANDDQNVIVLQEDSFCHLANRYIAELKKGNFMYVLSSQPIKEESFVKVIGKVIDSGHYVSKKRIMEQKINDKAFLKWLRFDPVYRQDGAMEAVAAILEIFPTDKTLFHWVIATGRCCFFNYFWKNISQKQQQKYLRADKSMFSLALLGGCKEIIKRMLESGADVNSTESQYALQRIVINGRHTKLLPFLSINGISMSFIHDGKSPLFYAITTKNLKTHAFLVEEDSKQNPLHKAVYYSNIEQAEKLLKIYNINLVSKNGWSVFHFAAYNNDITMMKCIFQTIIKGYVSSDKSHKKALKFNDLFSAIDKRDKIGWSPLHLAFILCNYEIVDFLINKDAADYTGNLDEKSLLHFPCNEQLSGSLLQYEHCLKKQTSQMISTVSRHQPTEDITYCKDLATSVRDVRNNVVNLWLYTNEVIMENNIDFEQDKENNWTPFMNNFPVYQDFMKKIPNDMKNWRPSVFALIYVTCMNILFFCFSVIRFRRKIDLPDNEGNTHLHAAASNESQDDSIELIKRLLKRGANPLFYNINGCKPSDVAFNNRSYRVKLFLDVHSMNASKQGTVVLVLMTIISFLLVITLCLASYFVCTRFQNFDVMHNMNNASTCISQFHNYSNTDVKDKPRQALRMQETNKEIFSFYSDINLSSQNNYFPDLSWDRIENNQNMYLQLFICIHVLSIYYVLFFNVTLALQKKILSTNKSIPFEGFYYMYVHLATAFDLTYIYFFKQSKFEILKFIILDFCFMNSLVLFIDTSLSLKQIYHSDWFMFIPFPFKFLYFCLFTYIGRIFYPPVRKLILRMVFITFTFATPTSWSIMLILVSFFFAFCAIHIYINVIPCCLYLILLKVWEQYKEFRIYSYCLQLSIFYQTFHSPLCVFPRLGNPSFTWLNIFQATLIFILINFETFFFTIQSLHIDMLYL